ncbi:hypothetical protein Zmor_021739 [Zophobas morio]|uniref:THAP domain-containing protein 9 n=1 Tax=Zophobas morio TaxID=2755281 RepID=A0AA38I5M8_9CUCU|nr:hypothetical protein Zmor_021739 [Zophobas morio]
MQEILNRQLVSKNRKYSPDIRTFALTLHFYSAHAYNYLRSKFNNLLPHPETIRRWYLVINGKPGFTQESFEAIRLKVKSEPNPVVVNLVLDEMSLRHLIDYQNGRYYGCVDLGTDLNSDGDENVPARNALVVLAVALNNQWTLPIAYFLINSLKGRERANIVKNSLELLHETGALCYSVTFDGASVNVNMCNELGTNYNLGEKFQPYFFHPCTKERVNSIWDACHMIKLLRNTLEARKTLYNSKGEKIEWTLKNCKN